MEPQNPKRQNTQINNKTLVKDINITFYIARKSEKLASAVYRVTDILSDKEPIKWTLRKKSLRCMLNCMSFSQQDNSFNKTLYKASIKLIDEIIALLDVSFTSSLVSQMNFSILNDEYKDLKNRVEEYKNKYFYPINLKVTDLEKDSVKQDKYKEEDLVLSDQGTEHKKNLILEKPAENYAYANKYKRHEKDISKSAQPKNRFLLKEDKGKRREIILNYIKKHGEVSIKDIFSIPELSSKYSEKTIQRELIDMVNKGVIKKKGERRWSRYFL